MKTHTLTIKTDDGNKQMTVLDDKEHGCIELAREIYEMKRFVVVVCCGVGLDLKRLECD